MAGPKVVYFFGSPPVTESICSILEQLDLHIGKQKSSLLAKVGMLICIFRFYSILFAYHIS